MSIYCGMCSDQPLPTQPQSADTRALRCCGTMAAVLRTMACTQTARTSRALGGGAARPTSMSGLQSGSSGRGGRRPPRPPAPPLGSL